MRKAVVLDKSGTIIDPCRVVYNIEGKKWLYHISTLKYVVEKGGVLVNLKGSIQDIIAGNVAKAKLKVSCCALKSYPPMDKSRLLDPVVLQGIRETYQKALTHCSSELGACVAVVFNPEGKITDVVGLGGKLYPDVKEAVRSMQDGGVDVYLATGNCKEMTLKCADLLNIPRRAAIFDASPEEKRELVRRLRGFYGSVVMVGNDINDLIAMREADVSVLVRRRGEFQKESLCSEVDYFVDSLIEVTRIVSEIKPVDQSSLTSK
ncbi:MAG: HAD family hydrolase [Candidatus Methanosuratincola petrocarbonis]